MMRSLTPLVLLFALSCGGSTPSQPSRTDGPVRPNVIVITLDTTRADRLGAYGHAPAKTPHLDALAEAGWRYEHAYSPLPLTIPSHATLFTGQNPPTHGIRSNGSGVLGDEADTLAELFARNGYATLGSVAAFVTSRRWGFEQGFETFYDDVPHALSIWDSERSAEEVVDDVLDWKASQNDTRPHFVWAHLFDAHFPYHAPEAYRKQLPDRPYDAEIAYMDAQIGRIVEAYAGTETVFVVVGDHGEALGEHDEATHSLFVYNGTQRIPFIVSGSGVEAAVVETPVGLADVAPTLLELLGVKGLEAAEGRAVTPETTEARPVYMESYQLPYRFGVAPHVAVVSRGMKLIDLPRPELYALTDLAESTDLASDKPEVVQALRADLAAFKYPAPSADDLAVQADVAEALAALGYVEGSAGAMGGELGDPKDHVSTIRDAQKVDQLTLVGNVDEALALLRKLVVDNPKNVEFKRRLSRLLVVRGEYDEGLALVEEAEELNPDASGILASKAAIYAQKGDYGEAARLYVEAAEGKTVSPRIRAAAVRTMFLSGDRQGAMRQAMAYLDDDPTDHVLEGTIGVLLAKHGKPENAVVFLERGALASLPEREVSFQLAALARGRGKNDEARELLERELQDWPTHTAARLVYVRLVAETQDWEALLQQSERLLLYAPKVPEAHFWKAQALFNLERFEDCEAAIAAGRALDDEFPKLLLLEANLIARDEARRAEAEALVKRAREIHASRSTEPPPPQK